MNHFNDSAMKLQKLSSGNKRKITNQEIDKNIMPKISHVCVYVFANNSLEIKVSGLRNVLSYLKRVLTCLANDRRM